MPRHRQEKAPMEAEAVQAALRRRPSPTDPQGSYTGRPANPDERPVQDADDL